VRYTHGESFYPMDVGRYVESSSLWLYHDDDSDEQLVAEGSLTMDELVKPRDATFGSLFYLRFLSPLGLVESARALGDAKALSRKQHNRFHAGVGRLARGGLLPRVADGLFSLSLFFRGKVPGATAAAAVLKYADIHAKQERYVYQGRVVRQGGWTVCQYWFFYAYNNWRSGFYGVNDHESDWEMVCVYLYEDGGMLVPEWTAYASHDFHGADLRRRWDDRQDLELVGNHPVVNAGAGSHASYFKPGEYQAEVPFPIPGRIRGLVDAASGFWQNTLGQGGDAGSGQRIPFIDFARADGLKVGPGQDKEWEVNLISEQTPWVSRYRGMWGLYAQDPIAGENAPGGPMHERDGTPRPSWFDPLGFAELDHVPPPPQELATLEKRARELEARSTELGRLVAEETSTLQELGAGLSTLTGGTHLAALYEQQRARVDAQSAVVRGLLREQAENAALQDGLARRIERARSGRADGPREHIRHPMDPVPANTMRFRRTTEFWAAISVSGLLAALAAFILFAPGKVLPALAVLLIAFLIADSSLRGTFVRTINQVAVVLALIAAAVMIVAYWEIAIVSALFGFAAFLVYQRLRELRA
jgi:hypothetical protein